MIIEPTLSGVSQAALRLRAGGVVAIPTETVYGLAARIDRPSAIDMIYALKGRPRDNPLIVHAHDLQTALRLIKERPIANKLAEKFWPGPLTIVADAAQMVPAYCRTEYGTVAVRVPEHPLALAVIRQCGAPVAAPSANRSGRPSPTRATHVQDDLGSAVMVLDGGPCDVGIESTVVFVGEDSIRLLRPGAIRARQIEEVCGLTVLQMEATSELATLTPGSRYRHYAPSIPVILAETEEDVRAALQRFGSCYAIASPRSVLPEGVIRGGVPEPQSIYAELRAGEQAGVACIVVLCSKDVQENSALMDRLRRAAQVNQKAEGQ